MAVPKEDQRYVVMVAILCLLARRSTDDEFEDGLNRLAQQADAKSWPAAQLMIETIRADWERRDDAFRPNLMALLDARDART